MARVDAVTPGDAALAGYLQSVELTVANIYTATTPLLSETEQPAVARFQTHHISYADSLGTLAGAAAAQRPNQVLTLILTARLQAATDETAALTFLFGLENQLVATHAYAINTVTSADVIRLLSTIVPMTAARCAALGALAKLSTPLLFPNGPTESSLIGDGSDIRLGFDPAQFPTS